MKRFAFLLYGVVAYFIFFATFLYLVGFVGNLFVPTSLSGEPTMPILNALVINVSLLILFGVQHSVMARPWFKEWWTQYVPTVIERSTYLLFTCMALIVIFIYWQPLGGVVWSVENTTAQYILLALYASGYTILFLSTVMLNHFDLFGLRQVWLNFRNQPYTDLPFKTPVFYKYVRHPLYLGFLISLWAGPEMTLTRLFFAVGLTIYIFLAIEWEEHDLLNYFGEKYRQYAENVPKVFPNLIGRKKHIPEFEKILESSSAEDS